MLIVLNVLNENQDVSQVGSVFFFRWRIYEILQLLGPYSGPGLWTTYLLNYLLITYLFNSVSNF